MLSLFQLGRRVIGATSASAASSACRIGTGVLLVALLAGCTSASHQEAAAQHDVASVGQELRAGATPAAVIEGNRTSGAPAAALATATAITGGPDIRATASTNVADYVAFAVYHHPAVRAAYDEWKASVAAIAPARALPDPKFTFQADVAETLTSFMPGLMFDVMSGARRRAMADEATAASSVAYRQYVQQVVAVATGTRKAWVELAFALDTDRLYRSTIHAAEQAVALSGAEYRTGRGMANFDRQVRFQNILAEHHAHHASIAELVTSARLRFKASLGLLPSDPDPLWPTPTLAKTKLPDEAELWDRVRQANPELATMRAMVDMAVAGVDVARLGSRPDFSAGLMVDTKMNPLMFRPTATVTLPVWREKIRANIALAEARRDAAAARIDAQQLSLAAEIAQMIYMVREADSMVAYMDQTALPNLDRSLASAEAAVESGMSDASMIAEVQLMRIDMLHERLKALRQREDAAVDLGSMLADVLPAHAPLVANR